MYEMVTRQCSRLLRVFVLFLVSVLFYILLINDRGLQFRFDLFNELGKFFVFRHSKAISYHAEVNELVKRAH